MGGDDAAAFAFRYQQNATVCVGTATALDESNRLTGPRRPTSHVLFCPCGPTFRRGRKPDPVRQLLRPNNRRVPVAPARIPRLGVAGAPHLWLQGLHA